MGRYIPPYVYIYIYIYIYSNKYINIKSMWAYKDISPLIWTYNSLYIDTARHIEISSPYRDIPLYVYIYIYVYMYICIKVNVWIYKRKSLYKRLCLDIKSYFFIQGTKSLYKGRYIFICLYISNICIFNNGPLLIYIYIYVYT